MNNNKLSQLRTAGQLLETEHGKQGTQERKEFHEKSIAWYYGEILKNRRKEKCMTQQQLADIVGMQRSYIARVEKGETDIQLSSFFRIADALQIQFTPVFA